jgi:dTMP kinase
LSLDGLDGTGKSTQCQLLAESLRQRGLPITTCVDPGGTDLGSRIREILLHGRQTLMSMRAEALLFMASRAELISQVISPARSRGEIVLSDRYLLANVVYQGHAGGLDPNDLWTIGQFATSHIEPDLTIILDLPVTVAKARRAANPDRLESRDDWYFQRVRDGFLYEANQRPERFAVIDASGTIEDVHRAISQRVLAYLKSRAYPGV